MRIKELKSGHDKIRPIYMSEREGDIPHSLASIQKGKNILKYDPKYSVGEGIKETCKSYWEKLKQ